MLPHPNPQHYNQPRSTHKSAGREASLITASPPRVSPLTRPPSRSLRPCRHPTDADGANLLLMATTPCHEPQWIPTALIAEPSHFHFICGLLVSCSLSGPPFTLPTAHFYPETVFDLQHLEPCYWLTVPFSSVTDMFN